MSEISEAYEAYVGFGDLKQQALANADTDNELYQQMDKLKMERKRAISEFDAKIAALSVKIHDAGLPPSANKLKRNLEENLRVERRHKRQAFVSLVEKALDMGRTIPEIAAAEGISNWNLLYGIRRDWDQKQIEQSKSEHATELWEYSDLTGMHRYAINESRTRARVVNDSGIFSYFDLATGELLDGPTTEFSAKKAHAVRQDLDGEWTGPDKRSPNPYA